jgi:hypothetical protein
VTNVRRLPRPTTPATLRALARMSHELAVRCRLRGDDAGYSAHWRDVLRFDELATEARVREERIAVQIEERRRLSEGAADLVRRIRSQFDLEEARRIAGGRPGAKTMSARILDCTDEAYLRRSLRDAVALAEHRAHARHEVAVPRMERAPAARRSEARVDAAMTGGSLVHILLLGAGKEIELISRRTTDGRGQGGEGGALKAGKIPVLVEGTASERFMVRDIRLSLDELGIELSGVSEVKLEWEEDIGARRRPVPRQDGPRHRRQTEDLRPEDRASAHPKAIARHVIDYGYDIQHAAYVSAASQAPPDLAGRERLHVSVRRGTARGLVARVHHHAGAALDGPSASSANGGGSARATTWALCLSRPNVWPGYADGVSDRGAGLGARARGARSVLKTRGLQKREALGNRRRSKEQA